MAAPPAFDFDEWSELYRRDPAQFEARRQALLAVELARGTPAQAAAARSALARFEKAHGDDPPHERMLGASRLMLEGLDALNRQMDRLRATLDETLPADPPQGHGRG